VGLRDPEVCIVGAGMSGLLMGIRLKQAGIESFRIHEKASSLGGTWRENTYPGLTCDVPSFFYSYSFEPNLDWSRRFSPGPEILAYFQHVAEKYGLLPHIAFDSKITGARYEQGRWSIETSRGEKTAVDVLVTASGALHQWRYPEIDGLEKFEGAKFHSAAWDHGVKLEGKRIGVVGNGSSGVQMMAPLSEVASHLTMFQRTAQWIAPVGNHVYTPAETRRKHRIPFLARLARFYYQQMFEVFSVAVVEPGRRRRGVAERCRNYLASVEDPELRRKLTPDYEPMCKRLIMSRDFYPTLTKEHVELVTEGIDHVEARGVVTGDGRLHELDVLVLATGFDTHAWGVDHVVGEDGLSLKEAWAQGTRAYRSVAVPGFPNFFTEGRGAGAGADGGGDTGVPRAASRGHEGHRVGDRLQQLVPGRERRPQHVAVECPPLPPGDAQAEPRGLRAAQLSQIAPQLKGIGLWLVSTGAAPRERPAGSPGGSPVNGGTSSRCSRGPRCRA
jgi:cation diffusion facilitator CzcD-associated flavoprotein CzcO